MFDIVAINYFHTNDMINEYRQICPFLSLQLLHYEYSYCAWKYGKSMCYHVITGSFICLLLSAWKKRKKNKSITSKIWQTGPVNQCFPDSLQQPGPMDGKEGHM